MRTRRQKEQKLDWLESGFRRAVNYRLDSVHGLEAGARWLAERDQLGVDVAVRILGPGHLALVIGEAAPPMATEWVRRAVWPLVPSEWVVEIRQAKKTDVPSLPRRSS